MSVCCDVARPNRHGANGSFCEILRFYSERMVVSRPVVLPCNRRRQFHQSRLGETLTQTREQRVRNFHRNSRHRVRVLQHQSLKLGKVKVGSITVQIRNLLARDPMLSAHGRADVDSKRTADQRGHAQFGKALQLGVHQLGAKL